MSTPSTFSISAVTPSSPNLGDKAGLAVSAVAVLPAAKQGQRDLRQTLQDVAQHLEDYLRRSGRDLSFRVDEGAGATVVTVRDASTGEIIRQMPSEEALRLLRRLNEGSATLLDRMV
ncbi:MAG: flagellar protein FlaG [Pseudomonadota bacterium]